MSVVPTLNRHDFAEMLKTRKTGETFRLDESQAQRQLDGSQVVPVLSSFHDPLGAETSREVIGFINLDEALLALREWAGDEVLEGIHEAHRKRILGKAAS